MQALGTMAGGIAHDFNNIVGAILGNVQLAKADCHNPQAMESLLEIEKAGRRARDLVRQILTFSRNEPPKLYTVRAHEVMRDTERLLRVTLPPAIELQVDASHDLPSMLADPTQVEQALFNLTTNAVHALAETRGGLIRMHAALSLAEQRVCDRLGLSLGNYVVITVQDNGPGIPPATLQRIFEPFFTTKPVGQGTGLGLAVVHGVMRTHGGAVDVISQQGQGSTFMLYFPVSQEGMASAPAPVVPSMPIHSPAPPAAGQGAPAQRKHVMYVDDDQALVSLVQRLLRRRGYQVTGFLDPREATQALRDNPAAYDLVVTDYNMPGYCGVDLVRDSKAIRPDLPVALASGYVTAEIEAQAIEAGALALIYKPNDVDELCATVDRLIHPQA